MEGNTSQLPDISDHLVTSDNPPRTDLDGMDHARCAALHNYLVDYNLAAGAGHLDQPDRAASGNDQTQPTYLLTKHGDSAADAIRPRLHASVAAFLGAARVTDNPLFYFVDDMPDPNHDGGMFVDDIHEVEDEPVDSVLRLYFPHADVCYYESGGGLFYHQGKHLASFLVYPDDTESTFPMDEHSQCWYPLETILSNWIDLIRLGKVAASPIDRSSLHGGIKIGNWEWWPYGERQVAGCVRAWDRLCGAIESRRPRASSETLIEESGGGSEPLLTSEAMDAAGIPSRSFARRFLGLARRPLHIRNIAPGLFLPPADASVFAAAQPFTHLPRHVPQYDDTANEITVPPVYMFFSDEGAPKVDITEWKSSFRGHWDGGRGTVPAGIPFPSSVPTGVYSQCVDRSEPQPTGEGFRMLLPFNLWGASLSDGSEIKNRTADELFQHGFKPFGGTCQRSQRLERLLDHWAGLVERGVWAVGPQGVQGSIDMFKDAVVDTASYTIPPSW